MQPLIPGTMYVGTNWAWQGAGVFKSLDRGDTWTAASVGMPKDTGMLSLAVDPFQAQTVYAGTSSYGGVYRSDDGGAHWHQASAGMPSSIFTVWALAADPWNDGVILAGTEDGIFRSADRGVGWEDTIEGDYVDSLVWAIAFDPSRAGVVYAGADRGILKSLDGGQTWKRSDRGTPRYAGILDLAVNPLDPDIVYAIGYLPRAAYMSSDGGETWRAVFSDPPGEPSNLAIDPVNPDTVYIDIHNKGVYRSTNAGQDWQLVSTDLPTTGDAFGGNTMRDLLVHPCRPNILYVATNLGLYRSVDSGVHWTGTSRGIVALTVDQIAISPANPGQLYVRADNTPTKLYCSTDGGKNWEVREALEEEGIFSVWPIATDPTHEKTVYVGTVDWNGRARTWRVGVFKSTDAGLTWTRVFNRRDRPGTSSIRSILVHPSSPHTVFIAVDSFDNDSPDAYRDIFKSTNGGKTWVRAGRIPEPDPDLLCLAADPGDTQTLYVGGWPGIYRSHDGGSSWIRLTQGLPGDTKVNTIVIDPSQPQVLYAGTEGDGVYRSRDGGLDWSAVSSGLLNLQVTSLAIDPASTSTIYAGTRWRGLFKSIDAGETWRPVEDGLKTWQIWSLAIDPSEPSTVYAGSATSGIFVTRTAGE